MNRFLNLLVVGISLATIVSGLAQVVAPAFVLGVIGAGITPTTAHFFAIVGMFMALFGGLMLHTVYGARSGTVAILWCALQKLGACVAVGVGILQGIFSEMAAGVAAFDLLSGVLFLYYLKTIKSGESA
ncbi:patatin [Parachryseolinea silvisoli]|uniref:patatin n=1 Tax=Parachryseolinea silvisoli TaxID=2873601 RepID=UPI002265C074|nr:patatin [Parachryseolinea silvisoli]MCD9018725.1 patatin [Parachryseolinea silvisoli]